MKVNGNCIPCIQNSSPVFPPFAAKEIMTTLVLYKPYAYSIISASVSTLWLLFLLQISMLLKRPSYVYKFNFMVSYSKFVIYYRTIFSPSINPCFLHLYNLPSLFNFCPLTCVDSVFQRFFIKEKVCMLENFFRRLLYSTY